MSTGLRCLISSCHFWKAQPKPWCVADTMDQEEEQNKNGIKRHHKSVGTQLRNQEGNIRGELNTSSEISQVTSPPECRASQERSRSTVGTALQKNGFGLTHRTESHFCLALACGATLILQALICSFLWFFFSTTVKMGTVSSSLLPSPNPSHLTSVPVGSLPTWVARNQAKKIFSAVLQLWRTLCQRWKAQWYQSHLYADFFVAAYCFVFPNADLEFNAPFAGEEKWFQKEGTCTWPQKYNHHSVRGKLRKCR